MFGSKNPTVVEAGRRAPSILRVAAALACLSALSGCAVMRECGAARWELANAYYKHSYAEQAQGVFDIALKVREMEALVAARIAYKSACPGVWSNRAADCADATQLREIIYEKAGYSQPGIGLRNLRAADRTEYAACKTKEGLFL